MQPALTVNRLLVLFLDLLDMFLTEPGVRHVAHHHVPPSNAQLPLFLLGGDVPRLEDVDDVGDGLLKFEVNTITSSIFSFHNL